MSLVSTSKNNNRSIMPSTAEKSTRGSHLSLMFEAGMLFAMLDLMSIKINGSQLAKMKKSIPHMSLP